MAVVRTPGARALLGALLLSAIMPGAPAEAQRTGIVVQVVDGTTIQVRVGDAAETVCYIGVAVPEIPHPTKGPAPYREAASGANRRLVDGKRVVLSSDTQQMDAQGCRLAYVFVNGQNVSAELLHRGFAELAVYPPNLQYGAYFRSLQHLAFVAKRGLWADEEVRSLYKPRGSGVIGHRTTKQYFHLDDPEGERVPRNEQEIFENAVRAEAAGYTASPNTQAVRQEEGAFLRGAAEPLVAAGSASPGSSYSGGSGSGGGRVFVRGYYRKDGTYVRAHTRRAPRR